jgi:hypothetical protein
VLGIARSVLFLIALIGLAIFFSERSAVPTIQSITTATALDDDYHPVDTTTIYSPEDSFAVSVTVKDYRGDEPLIARWSYQGSKITDTPLTGDLIGDITAGFVLQNQNPPWPSGEYTVEILYKDETLGSMNFTVKAADD